MDNEWIEQMLEVERKRADAAQEAIWLWGSLLEDEAPGPETLHLPGFTVSPETPTSERKFGVSPASGFDVRWAFRIPDTPKPERAGLIWFTGDQGQPGRRARTFIDLQLVGNRKQRNLIFVAGWAKPEDRARISLSWDWTPGSYLLEVSVELREFAGQTKITIQDTETEERFAAYELRWPVDTGPGKPVPSEPPWRLHRGHAPSDGPEQPWEGFRFDLGTVTIHRKEASQASGLVPGAVEIESDGLREHLAKIRESGG